MGPLRAGEVSGRDGGGDLVGRDTDRRRRQSSPKPFIFRRRVARFISRKRAAWT